MFDSNFSNLRKLIKLDMYFRNPNKEKCTLDHILRSIEDDPDFGTSMSRSSLYEHLTNFRLMGAEFKGRISEKSGKFTYAKAEDGRTPIFQYVDVNKPIPALAKLIGETRKDSGMALLTLLESDVDKTNSVLVWLRLFLNKMLKSDCNSPLEVVSFYENRDSNIENIKKFETLLQAILDKQPLELYCPKLKRTVSKVQPYLLKNYNQRWYLIAKARNDEPRPAHPGDYYEGYSPIALNQIEEIKNWDDEEWIEPDWEELWEYYDETVGVTVMKEGPQDVYLRFDPERYEKYVATKPIVRTQRLVKEGSEYYDPERPTVHLRVHVSKELVQQILSFGKDCAVVAPESLKDQIKEQLTLMMQNY